MLFKSSMHFLESVDSNFTNPYILQLDFLSLLKICTFMIFPYCSKIFDKSEAFVFRLRLLIQKCVSHLVVISMFAEIFLQIYHRIQQLLY